MTSAKALLGLVLCLCLQYIAAKSFHDLKDQAFLITGSHGSKNLLKRQTRSTKSEITRMHVTSVVRSRFAKVTTVSEMENTHEKAQEITFSVRLPEAAFITEFNMLVGDVTFVGKVKRKELAEAEYQRAVASGNSAGLVSANVRETRTFSVAANVPAHSSVTFTLVYQELLKRKLGKYNHKIFVNPSQIVDDFVVNVYITEQIGITMLEAETPHGGAGSRAVVASGYDDNGEVAVETHIRRSKNQAKITFKPTPTQQRRLLMIPEDDRKLTVVYDVTRENLGGEIQTNNGYFVHYFAPENLPVLPKKIVFVIDRSGSMYGTKMEQTKKAFRTVIKELSDADEFNIVDFSNGANVWKPRRLVSVTKESVEEAIAYVMNIEASGGTNLEHGLALGAKLLKHVKLEDKVSAAVITLSDGDPNVGVVNEKQIEANLKKYVNGRFSVFCIGFGQDLHYDFLKRLAEENGGITRKIYEDSDAVLQLAGFFKEVATPLLLKVSMEYSGSEVSDVSKVNFNKYFGGSEVIIVGVKNDAEATLEANVHGVSASGNVNYDVVSKEVDENFRHWYEDPGDFGDFIEKIWAHFTINELLEKKVLAKSKEEIKSIIERVTELALKYQFVTPMTSMVVVLPEDEITTTPSTSTMLPPIPACYLRGSQVPDDSNVTPIWCPYIFEKQDGDSRPFPNPPSLGRTANIGRHRAHHSRKAMAAPSRHHMSRVSALQYSIAGVAGQKPPFGRYQHHRMAYYRPRPEIQKDESCSGNLTSVNGTITSPGPHHADRTVYCEWDIILPTGSWIDLRILTLNTTQNKVVVSSNKQKVVNHNGGVGASKYLSLTNNKLHVKMTIHPEDMKQPGIVISYTQFTPEIPSPSAVNIPNTMLNFDSPNCGEIISSEDVMEGYISSPNYPDPYSGNAKCLWTITNSHIGSHFLQLTVLNMDIEINGNNQCDHDKMVVFSEGGDQTQLCGSKGGQVFNSSEEIMKIAFMSDGDLESGGFQASYKFLLQ